MRRPHLIMTAVALLATTPVAAQLGLPGLPVPAGVPVTAPLLDPIVGGVDGLGTQLQQTAARLARQRLKTIDRLVRRDRDLIELDAAGEPARRGELLLLDVEAAEMARIKESGFTVLGVEDIAELGIGVSRVGVPLGMSLAEAQRELAAQLPDAVISADNLHFPANRVSALPVMATASSVQHEIFTPVGMIDGAPGASIPVAAAKGFAKGAPYPSDHGSAVASLLKKNGVRQISVADVYGTDPAGGNALAIARALGWLAGEGTKVVTISLVGPKNSVLARAISSAQAKGIVIIAAVGNDGPAAPPAYPASYDGVVAVTGVDRRSRPLIEAGRALHLDYSAPGADVYAANAKGKILKVRGTSFAAPLVAARAAFALGIGRNWRAQLDREARDLGPKGHDALYGRGVLCSACSRSK